MYTIGSYGPGAPARNGTHFVNRMTKPTPGLPGTGHSYGPLFEGTGDECLAWIAAHEGRAPDPYQLKRAAVRLALVAMVRDIHEVQRGEAERRRLNTPGFPPDHSDVITDTINIVQELLDETLDPAVYMGSVEYPRRPYSF